MEPARFLPVILLGLALAADAFAAALCQGAAARARHPWPLAITVGLAFGVAQALAPLIGWALSFVTTARFEAFDHWIAFAVLAVLGGKLIYDGFTTSEAEASPTLARGWALLGLAIATSIDAAAAGLALPALGLPVLLAVSIIGVVTFVLSGAGVLIGRAAGVALGDKAELVGGVALILVGVKILIDHNAFG